MIHKNWINRKTVKKVKCVHTNAKKYKVDTMLTEGRIYDVKSETEEFYFLIDNSGRIGGYYKEYFTEVE